MMIRRTTREGFHINDSAVVQHVWKTDECYLHYIYIIMLYYNETRLITSNPNERERKIINR